MTVRFVNLIVFSVMVCVSVQAASPDISDVPLPEKASIKLVSTSTVHNGLALSMAILQSPEPLEQSAQFYRDLWSAPSAASGLVFESASGSAPGADETPAFIESELNHWLLISRLEDGIHTVIQLDKSLPGQTAGYISLSRPATVVPVQEDQDFPELLRLSTTESRDGSDLSTLSVYASHASVTATEKRSFNTLSRQGWSLIAQGEQGTARTLVLARGSARLEIVIARSDEYPALVVVNRIISQ